jgi:uncharacterized membrane protein YgdD (TMEM256/DUF423 family)
MIKRSLITGALLACLAVILGAYGAHGLKNALGPEHISQVQSFDTAARYQMYHAFALIVLGIIMKLFGESRLLNGAYTCFVIGILLFSGSLYLLSTRSITGLEWPWLGPVTPLGGLFFILGWVFFAVAIIRKK